MKRTPTNPLVNAVINPTKNPGCNPRKTRGENEPPCPWIPCGVKEGSDSPLEVNNGTHVYTTGREKRSVRAKMAVAGAIAY